MSKSWLLLPAMIASACSAGDGDGTQGSAEAPVWTIAVEPSVVVGGREAPAELFERVADGAFLREDAFVVADNGRRTLRVYDMEGNRVSELSGSGEGPGEVRSITGMWVADDTIGVYDGSNGRLTWFSVDGDVLRTTMVTASPPPDMLLGRLPDGSFAFARTETSVDMTSVRGSTADTMRIVRIDRDGEPRSTFGRAPGFTRWDGFPHPFSPFPQGVTAGARVVFTDGARPRLRVWRGDGIAESTIRLPSMEHDVPRVWEELTAALVARDREDLLDRLEGIPREERIPHLASLLAGPDGELWVRRYRPDLDAQWLGGQRSRPGGDWWVVDGEGEVRVRVRVPDDLELLDVAEDRVLAVARDALGVERVVVHGLVR